MNKIISFFMLLFVGNVFAQFESNRFYFGANAGIAKGANASDDKVVPSYRLFLQHRFIGNWLFGQFGGGYTKLQAKHTYWARTVYVDERLLIVPYSTEYFLPYFGAGIGLTKSVYSTGTSYLGYSPIFAGIQTRLGESIVFNTYGGFALSYSDSLDGRQRNNQNLNPITNGMQDGYWFWEAGLQFGFPGRKSKSELDAELEDSRLFEQLRQPDSDLPAAQADVPIQEVPIDSSVNELLQEAEPAPQSSMPATTMQDNLYRTIGFEFGGSSLSTEAVYVLRVVADTLKNNPEIILRIVGHADNQGTQAGIEYVAMARANAVKNWLIKNEVAGWRLEISSAGAREPQGDNNTHEGRAANRRVELWIAK